MEPEASTENHSILVVDDDELVTRVVRNILQKLGYRITVALDGAAALKLAVELRPAVIMVDLRMPGIDGHTIMRRSRAQGVDAAFVVISGSKDPEDIIDALRNGASDYLPKPFSAPELMTAVGRAVDAYERRRSSSAESIGTGGATPSGGVPKATTPSAPSASPSSAPAAAAPAARPPASPGVPAGDPIFAAILRRVQEGEILIPAVPAIVLELRRLLAEPQTTLEHVTTLIERDQRMAAQLLRVSNTVPYARGAQNSSVRTAVSRIGLRQIQSLVETIFAHTACVIRDPELAPLQANIWRYSVARAVSMRALAEGQAAPRPDPELAYLAGLFCDVGASFLLWVVSERNSTPGQTQRLTPDACLGFVAQNHQAIGAGVLSRWSTEPTMAMMSRVHHGNVLTNPVNPYALLECVAVPLAERLTGIADITGPARPASQIQECARRYKMLSLDATFNRVQPTYEAIVSTL